MTDPTIPSEAGPAQPDPSRSRRPRRESNVPTIVVGLIFLAIGGWYFLEQTIGIEMPRIVWREIWPVLLIALGAFMIVRSLGRRT